MLIKYKWRYCVDDIVSNVDYCIVRYINFLAQNRTANNAIGDDQANWAELWKVMSKSSDGRSALADSTRPSLFDIILKANAEARRKFY